MTVGLGDIVKVRNNGPTPLKWQWDSRRYLIPPGGEEFVPFECMKLYLGDPRASEKIYSTRDERGVVGFVSDRPTEVRRLRMMYDHRFGEYIPGEVNAFDSTRIPDVQVFDLRGDTVPTVIDDPEGRGIVPSPQTRSQQDDVMSRLQRQENLINLLLQRLDMSKASLNGADLPPVEPPPVPSQPQMVYDTRRDEVIEYKEPNVEEPEILDDLPEADD